MRLSHVAPFATVGVALAGCTFPHAEELSPDDPIRQRFGTTHNIMVNAPNIDDPNSGGERAMKLARTACHLPPSATPGDVSLALSQALGTARLFTISCPESGKEIQ